MLEIHAETRQPGGRTVLALRGHVDMATESILRATLRTCYDNPTIIDIHLDLSQVEFIGSGGVGILLSSRQKLQETQRRMAIVSASPRVSRILRHLKAEHLLLAN